MSTLTANTLVVSDEVTITVPGKTSRRFDLVYWVNGLPLVVVEVKSPTAKSGWVDAAREINDVYATEYPWFFTPNVFAVASDGLKLRFGAVGAPTNLWQPFRSTADDENLSGQANVQRSVELLMNPATILDMLANFALFDTSGGGADKKYLPRYPQMEAAHLIHERVLAGGSKGLVWHHQGSGKTLLMVFAASLLLADTRTESPTIILLSDRTQLVRQTSGVFTSAMGHAYFHQPATSQELRTLLADDVRGVISTTVHKFADAGKNLSARDNIIVMVDEAHRTQSARSESLAGQMRAALPHAKFFGMTGTPVRNLATDTFALFGEETDPGRVLHRYSVSRSLLDEATVPVMLDPHPVVFEMNDQALQAEFDQFADDFDLDDPDREALSRKFGRLTSVFANPDRIHAVCQDIVDHYLAGAYRNGLKAQVVAFNRELAVAYTDKINELLAGFEASQVLAEVGKHDRITAEVNISVSDSKDEDPAMRPFRLSEAEEEEQKRRFLTPDDPLCFLVVTAKLMTGFDAPNEGVLYLDKPLKAHTLFQTITRPNRTWVSPSRVREDLRRGRGLHRPGRRGPAGRHRPHRGGAPARAAGSSPTCPIWSPSSAPPSPASKTSSPTWTAWTSRSTDTSPCEPLTPSWTPTLPPPRRSPGTTGSWPACTRSSTPTSGSPSTGTASGCSDPCTRPCSRSPPTRRGRNGWASWGRWSWRSSTPTSTPSPQSPPRRNPSSWTPRASRSSRNCWPSSAPRPGKDDSEDKAPPSAAEILDDIKAALEKGVEPGSAKYTALAERIRLLRDRIIQNAQDALDFLSEALRVARAIVDAEKHPDEAVVVLDDDHVGVLSRIIHDHAPSGLTVTERNLAEEIDQVVTRTLTRSWDNADARNRGVRRATAAVFRRYMLKPVGEPYDSTVAYIEAHYLVD